MPAGLKVFRGGAFHLGIATHEGNTIACTTDFARIDTGLRTDDGTDVRSELFTAVAGGSLSGASLSGASLSDAAPTDPVRVLGTAVNQLLPTPAAGLTAARPGKLLPHLARAAGLSEAAGYTVAHGLLVSPFMWGEQVPQVHEPAGLVGGEGVTEPAAGRLTVMLQLLMITEEELRVFLRGGPEALIAALLGGAVPVLDWRR